MKLLEEKIRSEGKALSETVLKVDGFINHQVDPVLMSKIGKTLASYYMKATAELAADMNAKEILLADLIQEANLSLIQALDNAGEELRDEEWLLAEVRKGILQVIEEQTQVKFADDSLVARVEKLESAVRELNDDEDDKNAFSIDELAIILDMKVDEIRDILRLTGDDK